MGARGKKLRNKSGGTERWNWPDCSQTALSGPRGADSGRTTKTETDVAPILNKRGDNMMRKISRRTTGLTALLATAALGGIGFGALTLPGVATAGEVQSISIMIPQNPTHFG